ncbi:MAG: AraC family transcriptional regulator [Bacteroidaceae bacterium]|nr:AraC family transcriptional regulator [Bacteroidaceae bacterium]
MEHKQCQLDDDFHIYESYGNCVEPLIGKGASLPHKQEGYAVLICLQGNTEIKMNLHEYIVNSHELILVSPGDIVEELTCSDDAHYLLCVFNGDYFKEVNVENSLINQQLVLNPVTKMEIAEEEEITTLFRLMANKMAETDNPYKRKAINGYIQVVMSLGYNNLRRELQLQEAHTDSRSQQVFHQFILLVQQHYRTEHSISFYANLICLTPKYLSQLVQQASGRLAGDWINQYLLLEAKALLLSHTYSILEISESLSFSSPSAFIAFFKKHTGMTPKKFMNE